MYNDQGFPVKPIPTNPPSGGNGNTNSHNHPAVQHPSSAVDNTISFPPHSVVVASSSSPSQPPPTTQMYDQHGFPIKRYITTPSSNGANHYNNPPSLISGGGVRNSGGGAAASGVQLGNGAASSQSSSSPTTITNNPSLHHRHHMANLDRAVPLDVRSDWNSSLWDCFLDCGVCLDVCLCPCIEHARVGAIVVDGRQNSINAPILLVGLCFCVLHTCTTYFLRYEVAKRYHIQETACATCCLGCMLPWCTSCQIHREVLFRGEFPGGFFADEKPPRPPHQVAPM